MNMFDRLLALTDIETTGVDYYTHEIVDIGVILVNQNTFEEVNRWYTKVLAYNPEKASEIALKITGYNEEQWKAEGALTPNQALTRYNMFVKDCIFASWNPTFDWGFVNHGFHSHHIKSELDYHRVDLWTIAWEKLRHRLPNPKPEKLNAEKCCEILGIEPEGDLHLGINGAEKEVEIMKALLEY